MEWPKDMLEDIEDFRSERSIRSPKSNEEIEKLSVDENLSPLERALFLLSNGEDVQKSSVISSLAALMKQSPSETQRRVLPKICDLLRSAELDVHLAAASAVSSLLETKQLTTQTFNTILFTTVMNGVESKDSAISGAWLKTLLIAVAKYTPDVVRREILPVALAKGQLSQSVLSRLASCEMLGVIATKFESVRIRRELLGLVTSLCQDVDYEVRSCMCRQLEPIAKQLGSELTGTLILTELVELAKDEECSVRIACLETLVSLLDQLDKDVKETTVVPLLQQCFESALAAKDATLQVACRLCGKFCYQLKDALSNDRRKWFLDFYRDVVLLDAKHTKTQPTVVAPKTMGSCSPSASIEDDPIAECRRLCAYNLPAMALFAEAHNFDRELLSTLQRLANDQHPRVKRTVAAGFHEVAKILGPALVSSVRSQFLSLLKESSLEVLQGIIPRLGDSLRLFAQHASLGVSKFGGLPDFISAIVSCSQTVSKSHLWRLHEELVHQYCLLPDCLTSDQIYYKFVPRTFKLLSSKHVLPVRLAAGQAVCVFIRRNRRKEQRQELCSRLIEDLGANRSCWNRLLFIDVCGFLVETFSKKFFKTVFFEFVLVLAKDPVANVRLRLCRFLPRLKSVLKLPTDRLLLQQFNLVTRHLLTTEKDPDVQAGINVAFKESDRVDIPVETFSGRTFFEDDMLDAKKEDEERQIELEEEMELAAAAEQEKIDKESAKQSKQLNDTKKSKSGKKSSFSAGKITKSHTSPAIGRKTSGTQKSSPTQTPVSGSKSVPVASKSVTNKAPAGDRLVNNTEHLGEQKVGKKPDQLNAAISMSTHSASPRTLQKRATVPPLSPKPPNSPLPGGTLSPPSPLLAGGKSSEGSKSPSGASRGSFSRASGGVSRGFSGAGSTSRSSSHVPSTVGKARDKTSSHMPPSPTAGSLKSSHGRKDAPNASSHTSNGPPHVDLHSPPTRGVKPKT